VVEGWCGGDAEKGSKGEGERKTKVTWEAEEMEIKFPRVRQRLTKHAELKKPTNRGGNKGTRQDPCKNAGERWSGGITSAE